MILTDEYIDSYLQLFSISATKHCAPSFPFCNSPVKRAHPRSCYCVAMDTTKRLTVYLAILALAAGALAAQTPDLATGKQPAGQQIDLPTGKQLLGEIPGHPQRLN